MYRLGLHQRSICFALAVLLVLNALIPSLAHAMAARGLPSELFNNICSVNLTSQKLSKTQLMMLSAEQEAATSIEQPSAVQPSSLQLIKASPMKLQGLSHFEHCPMCLSMHFPLAIASNPLDVVLLTQLTHLVPERFFSAQETPSIWQTARSRAPPAFTA